MVKIHIYHNYNLTWFGLHKSTEGRYIVHIVPTQVIPWLFSAKAGMATSHFVRQHTDKFKNEIYEWL